ncbi:NAD(P)/FAD-dependent oxidoreductase [Campylobacter hyointestinalis]|uniref:NAD(P)/FAD-dependent oxidoreductase n=1 Tax=Campylobacter hyointestinalis TaxID=198 RepID=UPI001BD1EE07|nr:FAD/NAD(P)-binding oxidoreductase [Campylobacter hyointestinalis]MBT0611676.1 NAD(P)/FAD-dependent oxidoreductase [Campylobacter hyointestinalis subsp. hyointestinalis]
MADLNRRDALKLFAATTVALSATTSLNAQQIAENKSIKSRILIIGAGLAGISLAVRLRSELPNAKITLADKDEIFYYQPGFTLIAAGIYTADDVVFQKSDYIPDGIEWIKQNVISLSPSTNIVRFQDGTNHNYDYLVLATGVEYDFETIQGLKNEDVLNDTNISSVYLLNSSIKTNELMQKLANKGGVGLFCENKTPMKCSGVNKKVMMLSEDRARLANNRDKVSINLYIGGAKTFSSSVYAKVMEQMFEQRDINYKLNHQIIAVDKARNTAIFEHTMKYKENGQNKIATEQIEAKFDWLHVVPRQRAALMYKEAGLSVTNGDTDGNWISVNKETLQSTQFKNIFAIGDICGFPNGKTGASIRKMYPKLATNLINVIKGLEPSEKYDGYTACPLVTRYGKAVMVEFNWSGKPTPSMPCFSATRESYLNWFIKLNLFKPMVMQGMLRGLV